MLQGLTILVLVLIRQLNAQLLGVHLAPRLVGLGLQGQPIQ